MSESTVLRCKQNPILGPCNTKMTQGHTTSKQCCMQNPNVESRIVCNSCSMERPTWQHTFAPKLLGTMGGHTQACPFAHMTEKRYSCPDSLAPSHAKLMILPSGPCIAFRAPQRYRAILSSLHSLAACSPPANLNKTPHLHSLGAGTEEFPRST